LNAVLNGTAAILLALGYYLIRNGKREAHKRVMLTAFCTSILFLISYLTYRSITLGQSPQFISPS
jgi:putative membrane protein